MTCFRGDGLKAFDHHVTGNSTGPAAQSAGMANKISNKGDAA